MTTTELEENIKRALPDALRMGIKEAKKHSYEVRKLAFEGINPVYNCASVLKEFGDEESMNHLEKITKEYATLERQMKDYKTYLEKVEAKIVKGDVNLSQLDKLLTTGLDTKPKFNVRKHEYYKKFCEKAGIELEEDEDEDVVFQESESTRSTICPVTMLEFVQPLKNPACGHTYSEQGIKAHLQRNKKCPVAGCPQKLSFNTLERDVEMEVIISQKNVTQTQHLDTSSQMNNNTSQFFDEEEDDDDEYVVE